MKNDTAKKYLGTEQIHLPCNLCNGNDFDNIDHMGQYRFGIETKIQICKTCGHVFINPRWPDEIYSKFYEEDYRKLVSDGVTESYERYLNARNHGSEIYKMCHPFLEKESRVLDIGSSTGGILSVFQDYNNSSIEGIEPSIEESEYCKKKLNIRVKNELFENAEFGIDEKYDLIIISFSLNHFLNPGDTIKQIRSLLNPKGKIYIEVFNFLEQIKITSTIFQVDHIHYFNPDTLNSVLRKNGFSPLLVEMDTYESSQLLDDYMWDKKGILHMRFLYEATTPDLDYPYPDYNKIKNKMNNYLQYQHARFHDTFKWKIVKRISRYFTPKHLLNEKKYMYYSGSRTIS